MPIFQEISKLAQVKSQLSAIEFLDFSNEDLVNAHQRLGKEVRFQTQKILQRKLDQYSGEKFFVQLQMARQCRKAIETKILSPSIDLKIREALSMYLACLSAWSSGAALEEFAHLHLQGRSLDGQSVSADDLALLLQNDNTGCQTGAYREKDGAIVLWHTEEDNEEETRSRFDKLRIATFQKMTGGKRIKLHAFIYPELMPGPAYCWHDDCFTQAVDFLYLKQNNLDGHIFANVAAWVTFILGMDYPSDQVIKELSPYVDGYALTTIQRKGYEISATKMEFAGDQMTISKLENKPGDYLFQVNLISQDDNPVARAFEKIDQEDRQFYTDRINRTNRMMRYVKSCSDPFPMFFRILTSRLGDDGAYANENVKSYILARNTVQGMEIWIGAGPALKEDQPIVFFLKI